MGQDILIEETARLGDAATRSALKASLVDSAPAKAAASALRTQREVLESSPFSNLLPKALKKAIIDRPAELPELLESLLGHNEEDENILTTAAELREVLSTRLSSGQDDTTRISTPNAALDSDAIRTLLA